MEILHQRGNNPEEYAEKGIICRMNLFGVKKYSMSIPKEDRIFSNDGYERESARN